MSRFDYILHRADGVTTVELNSQVGTFRAVTSAILPAKRQDVSSAELTLVSSEAFTVNVGDWIEAKGMRLYCMSTIDRYTCSEDNNREYQLTFYDPIYYLRQAIFYNTSESVSEGVYSYSRVDNSYPSVGTFEDFVKLCCYNCNSVQGERLFKVGTINEDIATDIRVLNFSDYNCLAVLKQTCEEFETTWRVRINKDPDPDSLFIIDFGVEIEDFPVTLQVEKSQGLMSIEVTASDRDVFTQFVVKGGTDNLPYDYPHTNLQLDEDLEGTPPVYANSIIKLPELYARWGKSVKELIFEDINPSRTGTVTGINEDILKFTDSDLIGAEWSPVGGTIHFVSGHLIGFTFNCKAFNPGTGLITIESAQENNGFILPSETDSYYRIGVGDKYNVAGVSLPASYVSAAKAELKERALLVINGYWSQQRIESIIKIDPSIISVDIVPNMGFHIIHNALGIDKIIMAKQVVYDLSLNYPYDIESITVSDWATDDSRADTLHRRVALAQILAKKKQQKGDPGADGQTLYTWIKYADTPTSGMSDSPTGKTYIGIAVNKTTSVESSTYADYTWSLIKGADGIDGEPGPIGKRVVSGLVYYQLASSTAPSVPTATAYNFTNNAFTGLSTNWALTPPVFEAGNANKFWYVGFYVQETASSGGTGTPTFSTVKQAISFSGLVTFTGDNTVTDGQKTLSFGETGTTEINGGKITTGKVSAERIEVEDLIVKCLLTDVDDQGFRFDIRTINIDNDQVSQFRLYDPDSSVKAKIEMQGSGSEVYMNIENEEIGTSTDKDGFHVNDIDEYGNRTERVKLAKGEMFLSNENTGKEMLIGTDKIVFKQTADGENTELATLNIELIPRMIFASDWSGMTESQKKAIPLAYIYDINNAITNIYRYGGYAIPGTNVTLYASGVTSTDSRWTDMNNAYGDTPSTFAYCNKYNEEPRLYLAFDVSTLPSNAIITQFTIEAKVRGALGWLTTNKIWGGVLWDGSEQWDWDIANNGTAQLRYTSRAGQFTKTQMTNMRALFRSDLNGNAAVGREVRVYYAKLTLTYVTP